MKRFFILIFAATLLPGCNRSADPQPALTAAPQKPGPVAAPTPVPPPVPASRELAGTVFVATRGGANVMLGSVNVYALDWDKANAAIKSSKESCLKLMQERVAEAGAANDEAKAALKEWDAASAAFDNAQRATANASPTAQAVAVGPFKTRMQQARLKAEQAREKSGSALARATQFENWSKTGEMAFHTPPDDYLSKGVTDSKGAYQLQIPADRQVVLVAHSRRLAAGKEERYTWCVTVAPGEKGPVHLSNANWMEK
ncbi:MAG: hypothetical protein EBS05_21725 [Proteobacteria bacterium]|nr:hypothetical protein [Pseudomonadota bacterium]